MKEEIPDFEAVIWRAATPRATDFGYPFRSNSNVQENSTTISSFVRNGNISWKGDVEKQRFMEG